MSYFKSRFFDGKSIKPHEASVLIQSSGLSITIKDEGLEKLYTWHNEDLELLEHFHLTRFSVLGSKTMPGARLIIADEEIYKLIFPKVPKKQIHDSWVHIHWKGISVLLFICFCLILGLLWAIPKSTPFIAKHVPLKWEQTLGEFYINTFINNRKECISPQGQIALNKLTQKISSVSRNKIPFDIKVIDFGNNINAFAAPGYKIVVMRGLIDYCHSPDELAGILAHEMGHAFEHHPTQALIRQLGIKIIMTGAFGSSMDYPVTLLNLKYSRHDEQQADEIALKLLNKAHISPKGFMDIFERLNKEYGSDSDKEEIIELFSDHPGLASRIKLIQSQTYSLESKPSLNDKEWQALKNICN